MDNLICVYRTFDSFKADLIKSYLDDEGIFCFIKTNDASGTMPHLGLTQGGIEIMVSEKNLEESKKIINQINEENR